MNMVLKGRRRLSPSIIAALDLLVVYAPVGQRAHIAGAVRPTDD
jgi:hypothetical protein